MLDADFDGRRGVRSAPRRPVRPRLLRRQGHLFYDWPEMRPYLQEALAFSKRPDVHIWLNRFPPLHLEGYEHLIQDPYKLNDEVRGRKEEFARLLADGHLLDCREPERCKYCYLQRLCDTLDGRAEAREHLRFRRRPRRHRVGGPAAARVRRRSGEREEVEGGDSARRGRQAAAAGRRDGAAPPPRSAPRRSSLRRLRERCTSQLRSPSRAAEAVARFPTLTRLELRLQDYAELPPGVARWRIGPARGPSSSPAPSAYRPPRRWSFWRSTRTSRSPWSHPGDGGPALRPTREVPSPRARAPTYERLTESAEHDGDLEAFLRPPPARISRGRRAGGASSAAPRAKRGASSTL